MRGDYKPYIEIASFLVHIPFYNNWHSLLFLSNSQCVLRLHHSVCLCSKTLIAPLLQTTNTITLLYIEIATLLLSLAIQ